MTKKTPSSYSKFTFEDLDNLGLKILVLDLLEEYTVSNISPSSWLVETIARGTAFSLNTEKAKSEFLIAPILNELYHNNPSVFSVYSGFNFKVNSDKGLQGYCDFLLAKQPLSIIPTHPIIAIVGAKLSQDLYDAVPQCAAEMYAAKIWNERKNDSPQVIYGCITTGDNWLFLSYEGKDTIEVDKKFYSLHELSHLLGVWQVIIDLYK
jgi:hypothetical protein